MFVRINFRNIWEGSEVTESRGASHPTDMFKIFDLLIILVLQCNNELKPQSSLRQRNLDSSW